MASLREKYFFPRTGDIKKKKKKKKGDEKEDYI